MALVRHFPRAAMHTYTCSYPFRPPSHLACEHMFPPSNHRLAQRALAAYRLTRSFLLLEDDHDVDWEVDQGERVPADHPHRGALGMRAIADRLAHRRPGEPPRGELVCLCPVGRTAPAPTRAGGARTVKRRAPRDLALKCESSPAAHER